MPSVRAARSRRRGDECRAESAAAKEIRPVPPNLNAYAERFIRSATQECLDHFVVLGRRHLDHIVREYVQHGNTGRPNQEPGNLPL